MTHVCIIQRRANCVGDLAETFALIDARRMAYLSAILAECDRPGAAQLAANWSREYELLAATLSGERQIGDPDPQEDEEATRCAIDFGGPLPRGVRS